MGEMDRSLHGYTDHHRMAAALAHCFDGAEWILIRRLRSWIKPELCLTLPESKTKSCSMTYIHGFGKIVVNSKYTQIDSYSCIKSQSLISLHL